MQSYTEIADTTTLTTSRAQLLNNDKTALSCSSGTAFPTTNLQVGMLCFRTDTNKLYILKDATPTWLLLLDLTTAGGAGVIEAVNALLVRNTGAAAEGGQVNLQKPASGSTITGDIAIDIYNNQLRIFDTGGTGKGYYIDLSLAAASSATKIWTDANDGSGSGLDADTVDGYNVGNGTGLIPLSNGTVNTNLNADLLDGQHSSYFAPLASPTFTGTPAAPTATAGDNTTTLATTAFVTTAIANAKPAIAVTAVAANTTVVAADQGKDFYVAGTYTFTLPDATTVPTGYYFYISFNSGGFTINSSATQAIYGFGQATAAWGATSISHPNANGWDNVVQFLVVKYSTNSWFVIPVGDSHGSATFTSTGTWTAPPGVTAVYVTGIGGGGAGGVGSSNIYATAGGGGGGSGAIAMRKRIAVTPQTAYTVTVGGAGAASSFGALLTLAAGSAGGPGNSGNTQYGIGGAPGGNGSSGQPGISSLGGAAMRGVTGGAGAPGLFGAGAGRAGNQYTGYYNGGDALANTGAGGGGGCDNNSTTGGAGGSGIMIVEW